MIAHCLEKVAQSWLLFKRKTHLLFQNQHQRKRLPKLKNLLKQKLRKRRKRKKRRERLKKRSNARLKLQLKLSKRNKMKKMLQSLLTNSRCYKA